MKHRACHCGRGSEGDDRPVVFPGDFFDHELRVAVVRLVVGVEDELKGQVPIGFVVVSAGVDREYSDIEEECVKLVRDQIGPVAAFKSATVVQRLPKTRSGKVLRGTMQKIADNREYSIPATIDDPEILNEIQKNLIDKGFAQ